MKSNWLRRLFCRHEWEKGRGTRHWYSFALGLSITVNSHVVCKKCGKEIALDN